MKKAFLFFVSVLCFIQSERLLSQSISTTYSNGNSNTMLGSFSTSCSGNKLIVPLPSGLPIVITGLDLSYSMESFAPLVGTNQSSRLHCTDTDLSESTFTGISTVSGVESYNRTNISIANGLYSGGSNLTFELEVWRTLGNASCTNNQVIGLNNWTITIHYELVEENGVGVNVDVVDPSAILELNSISRGLLPPRMARNFMEAIVDPTDGLVVYCETCSPTGLYVYENTDWRSIKTEGGRFIETGNSVYLRDPSENEYFIFGRNFKPSTTLITDNFFFFDQLTPAVRGGKLVASSKWQNSLLGEASFGFGQNVEASGDYSAAFGLNSVASEYGSFAVGNNTQSTGWGSFASGVNSTASQYAATAVGESTATGYASFSSGSSTASGENATAVGYSTASGEFSFASGLSTVASGSYSTAQGRSSIASGSYSTALGRGTVASSYGEIVLGTYNNITTPFNTTGWDNDDPLLVVGGGLDNNSRANFLTLLKNGDLGLGVDSPEGQLDISGQVLIRNSSTLNIGYGTAGKFFSAGWIRYIDNKLNIHGGGSTDASKQLLFEAKGGSEFTGDIELNNQSKIIMRKTGGVKTIEIASSEIGTQGSQITLYNSAGDATIEIDGDYSNNGRLTVDEVEILGGADLAEYFDINSELNEATAGKIVSIDPDQIGNLTLSTQKYDRKVIGVISGANGISPGMLMGQEGSIAHGKYPIAIVGRVYVKANTENGAIVPGDFITTSTTPGEGMKATDIDAARGAIIGKAMSPIDEKTGFVLVFINLQ